MLIGIDLDNTIIDYRFSLKEMMEEEFPEYGTKEISKEKVKKYIRDNYGEEAWTEAQGRLYTYYLKAAKVYDGFNEVLVKLKEFDCDVKIVSHKTNKPIIGGDSNLREFALNWLEAKSVIGDSLNQIAKNDVFFANSLEEKAALINQNDFEVFVDDLPELLMKLSVDIRKYLIFAPLTYRSNFNIIPLINWHDDKILKHILDRIHP